MLPECQLQLFRLAVTFSSENTPDLNGFRRKLHLERALTALPSGCNAVSRLRDICLIAPLVITGCRCLREDRCETSTLRLFDSGTATPRRVGALDCSLQRPWRRCTAINCVNLRLIPGT